MGSRDAAIVRRDVEAGHRCFGVDSSELGVVYTRPSRRFFTEDAVETAFVIAAADILSTSIQ